MQPVVAFEMLVRAHHRQPDLQSPGGMGTLAHIHAVAKGMSAGAREENLRSAAR